MARISTLKVCALNIAMHDPHSPELYIDLMQTAYSSRSYAAKGDYHALIGSIYPIDKNDKLKGVTGEIYKFLHLDPSEPWFNLLNKEEAKEDELYEINIPAHLKPHLTKYPFVFFPKGHRLYFQTNGKHKITPNSAALIFKKIFCHEDLQKFGEVEITVEPDRNELEEIFNMATVQRLHIELFRPNPDDHEEDERKLLERLRRQNANRMQVDLTAARGQTLVPDEETISLANVAASNGYVIATGRDLDGQPIERSTRNIPWTESFPYNPEQQTSNDALLQVAEQMHNQLF